MLGIVEIERVTTRHLRGAVRSVAMANIGYSCYRSNLHFLWS